MHLDHRGIVEAGWMNHERPREGCVSTNSEQQSSVAMSHGERVRADKQT